VHFYHRLYITPGMHFGQFPDVTPGLTPGKEIPSNIPQQLTPNSRWTIRFAIGITLKTADFTKLTNGNQNQTAQPKTP